MNQSGSSLIDFSALQNVNVTISFDNTSLIKLLVVLLAAFVLFFFIKKIFA